MSLNKTIDELIDLYLEEDLEEISVSANAGHYDSPMAFTGNKPKLEKKRKQRATTSTGYTLAKKSKKKKNKLGESMKHSEMIKEIFGLNSKNSRQKVNGAVKEINRKLFEIERIIGRATKLKKEAGVSRDNYWKSTSPRMKKIAERLLKVSHKLRELSS